MLKRRNYITYPFGNIRGPILEETEFESVHLDQLKNKAPDEKKFSELKEFCW